MRISAELDERALREIYLPAFEKIVKEAKPWSIMAAYNKVNGTYATENNYLLNEILRIGETKTVSFQLNKRDFSYYDPKMKRWVMESGDYELVLGKSSRDICLSQVVNVISTDQAEAVLTVDSIVKEWVESSVGHQALFDILAEEGMKERIEESLGGVHAEMVLGMPIRKCSISIIVKQNV